MGRFQVSDPAAVDELWELPGIANCWISDQLGHTRTTPAHSRIAPGDLVFVYRSEPKVNGVVLPDPPPFNKKPHLIGVWWAVRVHRRQLPEPKTRVVTDVWHLPLVRFDDPVKVSVIRRHPELQDIAPFTNSTRAGLVEASPTEAAALVAACSLPSSVLTDPDPVQIAISLVNVRTGMRDEDLRYQRDRRARYEFIHAVEQAAVNRVDAALTGAGWSVVSQEHTPLWGADLDCARESLSGPEIRHVEVKGKRGGTWRDVVLQQSQYARAHQSARDGDGTWWLTICRHALQDLPDEILEFPAPWVAQHWPLDHVR